MANYTAYLSPLHAAGPYEIDSANVYLVSSDAVVLDENDAFMSSDPENPIFGLVTLYSAEPIEGSDDMADLRRKVEGSLWGNFTWLDPEVDEVTFKYMA